MFDDILVPTDGAPGVEGPATLALELATATDATIHSVAVTDTRLEPAAMQEQDRRAWRASARAQGEAAVSEIADRAEAAGIDTTTAVREGTPYEELLAYAEMEGIDVAVLGIYAGEADYPAQLGSTTERVITFGDVPVLTARPAENVEMVPLANRYDDVLVATDGSQYAQRAAEHGIAIAAAADATVEVIHAFDSQAYQRVEDAPQVAEVAEQAGRQAVEDIATVADDAGVPVSTTVKHGDPAQTITDTAETEGADLVTLGSRGLRSPTDNLLGSTASRVIRRARTPVFVAE